MKGVLNNNRGIALLVTLGVISVLLTGALHLAKITGKSIIATGNQRDGFIARQMGMSGIHLAMAIMASDASDQSNGSKGLIDSVQEDWANPEKISMAIAQLDFPPGSLSLKITDELGKIQVNSLIKRYPGREVNQNQIRLWENFLALRISRDKSLDGRDPAAVINALKDWLDSEDDDAITGLSGAESDYYRQLEPPYFSQNGPINLISELFLIKGFTQDLLETMPGTTSETNLDEEKSLGEKTDFEDLFTVYGLSSRSPSGKTYAYPGRININTARIEILTTLLPGGMESLAENLMDFRQKKSENGEFFTNLLDKGWYERVIDLSEEEKKTFDSLIRYDSNLFKAQCLAMVNQTSIKISAYILREKTTNHWGCRILQLTEE
jgi:general secretion pathway protein K